MAIKQHRIQVLLTEAEFTVLQWFIRRRKVWSKCDAFRLALIESCVEMGLPMTDLPELEEQRKHCTPKRRIRHAVIEGDTSKEKTGGSRESAREEKGGGIPSPRVIRTRE